MKFPAHVPKSWQLKQVLKRKRGYPGQRASSSSKRKLMSEKLLIRITHELYAASKKIIGNVSFD